MTRSEIDTEKKVAYALLALLAVFVGLFFAWMFYIEPALKPGIERVLGKRIYELPELAGAAYAIIVGLLPPIAFGFLLYAVAYYKVFMPKRERLVGDQLKKMQMARSALADGAAYIKAFEEELKAKSSEAERLQNELLSLKLVNSESVADLRRKLDAIGSVRKSGIWIERILAFGIGVLSSLSATYIWELFRDR